MDTRRSQLLRFYQALDARNVEEIMPLLHPEADFPDQLGEGRRHGPEAIRDYYVRAFEVIGAESTPTDFNPLPDGAMEVTVHHHVTSLGGALWHDGPTTYRFEFRDGLISRMDRLSD